MIIIFYYFLEGECGPISCEVYEKFIYCHTMPRTTSSVLESINCYLILINTWANSDFITQFKLIMPNLPVISSFVLKLALREQTGKHSFFLQGNYLLSLPLYLSQPPTLSLSLSLTLFSHLSLSTNLSLTQSVGY